MRLLAITTLSTSLLRVCGSDEAPPTTAAPTVVSVQGQAVIAAPVISAELRAPKHSGTVVIAQDHVVEVVPKRNGAVVAYVVDAQGHAPAPATTVVVVNMQTNLGQVRPVTMVWNAPHARFEGTLIGAVPAPGPINVTLTVDGHARVGQLDTYVIYTEPPAPVHVETRTTVVAPSAHVVVHAPRPSATLSVELNVPPPPSAEVRIGFGVPSTRVVVTQPRVVHVQSPTTVIHTSGSVHVRRGRGHDRRRGRGHDRHDDHDD